MHLEHFGVAGRVKVLRRSDFVASVSSVVVPLIPRVVPGSGLTPDVMVDGRVPVTPVVVRM